MKRNRFNLVVTVGWLAACVAACTLPLNQNGSGPHAWIDAPLNGSVVPANARVDVISHANDLAGISKVELSINDSVLTTDNAPDPGQVYLFMRQAWTPTAPGSYLVRVRAQTSGGQWSDYAVVLVTVVGRAAIAPPVSISPTPGSTATATLTATPGKPTLTLSENAFCRQGPDASFPDVTAITAGETVDIQGISQNGFWYFVFWSRFNVKCWVAASTGQLHGSTAGTSVIMVAVDTPTPTSTSAARPLP